MAFSLWAFMRNDNVSKPFRNTQALNGLMVGPAERNTPITGSMSSLLPTTAPPKQRPWPSIYLVAEWTIRSAPKRNGFCKAGVHKQLSTTNNASLAWARSANCCRSATSLIGLEGDSKNNMRVVASMASDQALKSNKST